MAKRDFYIKDSELDDYQIKIIHKKEGVSFIVKGCAGSGKSVLALWKVKQLQELGKSYLFVIYTKALRKYMEDGISQIGLNENNIVHYHDCFSFTKESGIWNKTWKKENIYEYIIIDEATDLSIEDINILQSHAKNMLIFGDTAQQLYEFDQDRNTASMEDIQYHTKYPMENLVFNHRLPKKIARFAQFLNSQNDDLEERCRNEGDEKPKILQYPSNEEQFNAIAELIENKDLEDVGILFRTNYEVDEAYEYFTKELGLDVEAKSKTHTEDELDFSSNKPKLMTYHSSKGLQFESVFLPECIASNNGDKNPLYVAITRTYKSLYIMHSGNLSSYFDSIPVDLYDTSLSSGTKIII